MYLVFKTIKFIDESLLILLIEPLNILKEYRLLQIRNRNFSLLCIHIARESVDLLEDIGSASLVVDQFKFASNHTNLSVQVVHIPLILLLDHINVSVNLCIIQFMNHVIKGINFTTFSWMFFSKPSGMSALAPSFGPFCN